MRIRSVHTSFSQEIECYVLNIITEIPLIHIDTNNFQIPSNIRLADPHFHVSNEIDMLTGAEMFWQLICIGQTQRHKNQPTFQKTQLGWIVGGKVPGKIGAKSRLCGLSINEQINQSLVKFWEMDQIINESEPFLQDFQS